jgi:hypothetical protein
MLTSSLSGTFLGHCMAGMLLQLAGKDYDGDAAIGVKLCIRCRN